MKIKKSQAICEQCGSQNLKSCFKTYPVKMDLKTLNGHSAPGIIKSTI